MFETFAFYISYFSWANGVCTYRPGNPVHAAHNWKRRVRTNLDLHVVRECFIWVRKREGENSDKFRLIFKHPNFYTAMRYAMNGESRKRIYAADDNKCNQNVALFKKVMVLHDGAARLLGNPNHAAFRLEDKMAKTPGTVHPFLGDLWSRLTAGSAREDKGSKNLKAADLASRAEVFDGKFISKDNRRVKASYSRQFPD